MRAFVKIIFILVTLVFDVAQMELFIDLETTYVNNVLSVYFSDTLKDIDHITIMIDFKNSNNSVYNVKAILTSPTNGLWIFGTEIEYAALFFHIEIVEVHVKAHYNNNDTEDEYSLQECWKNLSRTPKCNTLAITTDQGIAYYCEVEYEFKEEFNELDLNKWTTDYRHALYTAMEEFVLFNNSVKNIFIENNQLHIRPTIVPGVLTRGELNLGFECIRVNKPEECVVKADLFKVLPPVASAFLRSKQLFALSNIRIDIRAKLPKGDWIIPQLWLQKCIYTGCFGIRIAFARGNLNVLNGNGEDVGGSLLSAEIAAWVNEKRYNCTRTFRNQNNKHFGDDFHTYSTYTSATDFTFAVDNQVFGQIKIEDLNAKLKEYESFYFGCIEPHFHIALGVSVGGHTDFSGIPNKPWVDLHHRAAKNFYRDKKWPETWKGDEALIVDYVHIYANK